MTREEMRMIAYRDVAESMEKKFKSFEVYLDDELIHKTDSLIEHIQCVSRIKCNHASTEHQKSNGNYISKLYSK